MDIKRASNITLIFFITILFTACSYKNKEITDLKNYSQNPNTYTKSLENSDLKQEKLKEEFVKNYFAPWKKEKLEISKEEASWGNEYQNKNFYLENHTLASKQWFEKVIDNQNFEKYNTLLKKAILTRNSDIRVLPTKSALFYNPKIAGQGYPFDYNQNSRLKINTPVLISHYSKDKAWAYIDSFSLQGWIRVDNLYLVNKKEEKLFQNDNLYVIIKEGFEVFDSTSLEDLKVGTFFPKIDNKFLLANSNGLKKVDIKEYKIKKLPLEFSKENISLLAKEFMGELYGWGGLNNHRDCSSFTQDFFSPFAIYLNRNSKAQTLRHEYDDISKLSNEQKKEYIIKNAKSFLTLVYLKGHIMLYVGHKKNEPLVMHNFWGVRTYNAFGSDSRNVVGKTAITTLEPGIELFNANKDKTILSKVLGLVYLDKKSLSIEEIK